MPLKVLLTPSKKVSADCWGNKTYCVQKLEMKLNSLKLFTNEMPCSFLSEFIPYSKSTSMILDGAKYGRDAFGSIGLDHFPCNGVLARNGGIEVRAATGDAY